jgi:hypothetical protein
LYLNVLSHLKGSYLRCCMDVHAHRRQYDNSSVLKFQIYFTCCRGAHD